MFVNAHAGRTELFFGADYRVRVRFRDSAGEFSPWAERPFKTGPLPPPGTPSSLPWVALQPGFAIQQVLGGLHLPVGIAMVPNPGASPASPILYIAELYGTIKVLTRGGGVSTYAGNLLNFDPLGSFPGQGEFGVGGIAVQPSTGDVFASMVYESGGQFRGKVVRFRSTNGGLTSSSQTTLLDLGIVTPVEPQGPSHQISSLSFAPDGTVFVHQADAFQPEKAPVNNSYLGKILRFNPDNCGAGNPAAPNCAPPGGPNGNPLYNPANGVTAQDYVYAKGFRNPFGGAMRTSTGDLYEVENGPVIDRLARIDYPPAPGIVPDYGWDGDDVDMFTKALYNWQLSHAPVNIAFVQSQGFGGSGFPASKLEHAFVTLSGPTYAGGPQAYGKRIVEFSPVSGELAGPPATLVDYDGTGKATAAGLAAGADGLYFTDLYKDLGGASGADPGARLLRVRYFPPSSDCTLDGRTLRVSLAAPPKKDGKERPASAPTRARIIRVGENIEVNRKWCGATVDNIDSIEVLGERRKQAVSLDLRGGHLIPGAHAEDTGEPEIELNVDLLGGKDDIFRIVKRRGEKPKLKLRRSGADINRDGDLDAALTRVERVKIKLIRKKRSEKGK